MLPTERDSRPAEREPSFLLGASRAPRPRGALPERRGLSKSAEARSEEGREGTLMLLCVFQMGAK